MPRIYGIFEKCFLRDRLHGSIQEKKYNGLEITVRGTIIMHDLLPEGEELRRAVKWIASHLQENPDSLIMPLVNEAIFRFDLDPLDSEFLIRMYSQRKDES